MVTVKETATSGGAVVAEQKGGAAAWMPRVMPGIGRELSAQQELAIALRHLDDVGFCENLTGHITWQLRGCTTTCSSTRGDSGGARSRRPTSSPSRPPVTWSTAVGRDARVPHPHRAAPRPPRRAGGGAQPPDLGHRLVGLGILPEIIHQNSAMFVDELVFINEYGGEVDSADRRCLDRRARWAKRRLRCWPATASSWRHRPSKKPPTSRSMFERMCDIHYTRCSPATAPIPIGHEHLKPMKASLLERAAEAYWHGAAASSSPPNPKSSTDRIRISLDLHQHRTEEEPSPWRSRSTISPPTPRSPRTSRARSRSCPTPNRPSGTSPIISCDDHIVEPPRRVQGRVPAKFADRAPRIVEQEDGSQIVAVRRPAVAQRRLQRRHRPAGRRVQLRSRPLRRDATRRVGRRARVHDMDLNGIYASLNFPSFLPGFAGQRLQSTTDDRELAIACTRAWNDWMVDDVDGLRARRGSSPPSCRCCTTPRPPRRRCAATPNAACGPLTFTEAPHLLGLPSLHTGYWDPLMAACAETGTVVCLHVGSSSTSPAVAEDAPATPSVRCSSRTRCSRQSTGSTR